MYNFSMEITSANNHHLIETAFLLRQCVSELESRQILQWDTETYGISHINNDINHHYVYLARINNITVGTITVNEEQYPEYGQIRWSVKSGKVLVIQNLVIFPAWQKKGIGKKLLDFIEEEAIKKGYHSIRLHVHEKNGSAINFFKSREYAISGEFISELNQNRYFCFEKCFAEELVS